MARPIGLHLRITHTLLSVIHKAVQLELPLFQCFLMSSEQQKLLLNNKEIQHCARLIQDRFQHAYVHGSYGINLADSRRTKHTVFMQEMKLAKRLGFTHMVLHPGSTKGISKMAGIDSLVRIINQCLKQQSGIAIVLENSPHAGVCLGGDLYDFALILSKLDKPDQIKFCIDTAHAYVYGYDITHLEGQEKFIQIIHEAIGIERVALIHLNDTQELLGSGHDRHAIVGQGRLGGSLQTFLSHEQLRHVPVIMELPLLDNQEEQAILNAVRGWHI